jgi:transcriptional regulator with XRE-family HTH domain
VSIRTEIGNVLRRLRGEYSVQHVAEAMGITRQAVAKLEAGKVSLARLEALADFYGVDFHLTATDRVSGQVFSAFAYLEVIELDEEAEAVGERATSTRLLQVIGTPPPPARAPLPPREPATGRFVPPLVSPGERNRSGDAPVETAGQRRRQAG